MNVICDCAGIATAEQDVSNSPDFMSLLNKDGKIYSFTQFASNMVTDGTRGQIGALYLSEITQVSFLF